MGQHSSALLLRTPPEVLDNIAVLAVDTLGPPKELLSLRLVCRYINYNLNVSDVGSRVFRCKFDTSAPERRFSDAAMYPSALFAQLKSYSETLKVVRNVDIFNSRVEDHLWNVFFMLMENDGLNAMQLICWADVRRFIDAFVRTRLRDGKDVENNWPLDNAVNSLALWIMWLTLDNDAVTNETSADRQQLMELIRPYVINMVRYPVFHIPDNHFNVPIDRMYMGQFPFTVSTAHGPYPPYRDAHTVVVQHFSLPITLMPPLISTAARLLYFGRSEATPVVPSDDVPNDRAHALALGQDWVRPTRVDLVEFNALRAARSPDLGLWDPHVKFDPRTIELRSLHFDSAFQRLIDCSDPFCINPIAPYEFGSLTGDFGGRMLIPDTAQANEMLNAPIYEEGKPTMAIAPVYVRLTEWQCVNPQLPIPEGGQNSFLWDEGVRNGWFPEVVFHINDDVIRIKDRYNANIVYCYEKFIPGRPNSHDPKTCSTCITRASLEEKAEEERLRRVIESREAHEDGAQMEERSETQNVNTSSGTTHTPTATSRMRPIDISTLPVPLDPLDPRFVRTEIQATLGENVNLDSLIAAELANNAAPATTSEAMDVDSDESSAELEDGAHAGALRDTSPFEREPCTGVRDVIITGLTLQRHASAWHDYVFYGRVRPYDGLIALVRKPVVFPSFGVQIFRGYLVGGTTFVGNWRSYRQNPAELAQEGPFIARRTDFGE